MVQFSLVIAKIAYTLLSLRAKLTQASQNKNNIIIVNIDKIDNIEVNIHNNDKQL